MSILTQDQRLQVEKRLRERRGVLRTEIRDALLRAGTERLVDLADRLDDTQDQSLAELLADVTHADVQRDAGEIRDIEGAMQRLAAGTYGVCVACGTRIPEERLQAYPTAKRCRPCQQTHEQARARPARTGS